MLGGHMLFGQRIRLLLVGEFQFFLLYCTLFVILVLFLHCCCISETWLRLCIDCCGWLSTYTVRMGHVKEPCCCTLMSLMPPSTIRQVIKSVVTLLHGTNVIQQKDIGYNALCNPLVTLTPWHQPSVNPNHEPS